MSELTMGQCNLCPRGCGVDRSVRTGVCGCGDTMRVARAALHMWEEPCLSGERGSGAVFFAGCPLHCIFCQNAAISGGPSCSSERKPSSRTPAIASRIDS